MTQPVHRFSAETTVGDAIDDHERAQRIAINYRAVALSKRERAIADLAIKITNEPWTVEESHLQDLRDLGLTEEEIFDVIEVAALFNFTNRMSSAVGGRPDPEFFAPAGG